MKSNKAILITGFSGQDATITRHLLVDSEYDLIFTTTTSTVLASSPRVHVYTSCGEKDSLYKLFSEIFSLHDIVLVLHYASQNSSSDSNQSDIQTLYFSNVIYTECLLEACLKFSHHSCSSCWFYSSIFTTSFI